MWAGDAGLRARELSVQSLCDVMTAARSFGLTRLQVSWPFLDQKGESGELRLSMAGHAMNSERHTFKWSSDDTNALGLSAHRVLPVW